MMGLVVIIPFFLASLGLCYFVSKMISKIMPKQISSSIILTAILYLTISIIIVVANPYKLHENASIMGFLWPMFLMQLFYEKILGYPYFN